MVAIGADAVGKRELAQSVYNSEYPVQWIVDSRKQCLQFGEAAHAVVEGVLQPAAVIELGEWLANATNIRYLITQPPSFVF